MQHITINRHNVNPAALSDELSSALGFTVGISTGSYGTTFHVPDDITPAQIEIGRQIVIDHDPAILTPEQIAAAHAEQVEADSYTDIAAIPDWAHWDEETVLAWIDANTGEAQVAEIVSLETARAYLILLSRQVRALSRLCVALRNKVYPNLET